YPHEYLVICRQFYMKKVFPLIVIFITLSVLGIIFIQVSWIRQAIDLRRQQHDQGVNNAVKRTREELYHRYFAYRREYPADENSKNFMLLAFSVNVLRGEVDDVIEQSIRRSGIRLKYRYLILDIFQNPLASSGNFRMEHIPGAIKTQLTPENAIYKETLYLYFEEDNNYILQQMSGIIGASVVFTIIIISAFALTVRTLFTQRKLSEIKSDFINNMTH